MKSNLIIIGLVMIYFLLAKESYSQEYGVDKNSWMISGSLSFSKQNGELFEDIDGVSTTTILLSNNTNYFITKGLFLGLGINYNYQRTGAEGRESYGLGPNVGYAFGNKESKLYPFITGGYRFTSMMQDSDNSYNRLDTNGYTLFGGIGLIIPLKEHFAIALELDYSKYKFEEELNEYDGNILTFSVGFLGFIF